MTVRKYKLPSNSTFEEFKKGCFLLPLTPAADGKRKIDKWKGTGAKATREALYKMIESGIQYTNPNLRAKTKNRTVEESLNGLIESSDGYLNNLNPCVAAAYPLSATWIIMFDTHSFDLKQNKDVFPEILELNCDPYFYTYTLMQRSEEMEAVEDVKAKTEQELEKINEMRRQYTGGNLDTNEMLSSAIPLNKA